MMKENMNTKEFNDVYAVDTIEIAPAVYEVSVRHLDWLDAQMTQTEPATIVLTPEHVFVPTNHGLFLIRREKELWDTIPKIIDNNIDEDCPHFVDNRSAEEVFNYLLNRIAEECPSFQFVKRRDTTKKRR
jgi:hypothetical protein